MMTTPNIEDAMGRIRKLEIRADAIARLMRDLQPADDPNEKPTKPAAPEWVDGFPPVGSICEARHNKSDCWIKREILAIGETMAFVRIIPGQVDNDGDPVSGEHTLQIAYAEFRPIRTKAQCDREEVYILAQKAQEAAGLPGLCRERLEALYDAGLLRKEK